MELGGADGRDDKGKSEYDQGMTHSLIIDQPMAMFGSTKTQIRPNEKISVFRAMGRKILGRVGTLIFFNYFFSGKNMTLCILKGILPFKMHKKNFFFRKLEKKLLGFTSKFR